MTTLGLRSAEHSSYEELLRVIRRVRSRWRARRLILGFTMVGAAAVLVVGVSSAAMDALRYAPWVVRGLQAAAWVGFGAAVWRFVVRPLRSRVTDEQVALYVEEHDPTLREAVISGVELGQRVAPKDADERGISTDLTRLVVQEAIRRLETLNEGRLIEASALKRAGGALATVGGVAIVASLLAPPAFLRGAALLLSPWGDLTDANPYRVLVDPGDAAVARDSDRWIEARLEGFMAERVDLRTRVEGSALWESVPMLADPEDGAFRHLLLGIPEATDYYVDADGVLSPTFRIEVEDVPYVAQIGLVYRYPDHTGLSPREVVDGGDIAAVAGTVVELEVIPTVPATAGVVRLEPGAIEIPLEPVESPGEAPSGAGAEVMRATLTLSETGSYRVALAGPDGNLRTASRDYLIEVLEDLPPIVRFLRPGRDSQANPVEEVFTEVLAEDDYAVRRLEMRISVNGGEETREVLASGGARDEIQSGHTLFLEEHDLVPGDLVSYYAVARDGAGAEAATDMFFIAVRPFDRTYRQADSMPGGGGGAGDGLDGTLSLRQKQIVVATFKILRDRQGMPQAAVTETVATIGLAQGRLREQVATLNRRLRNRGIGADPEFAEIVEHLDAGLGEMTAAEELLIAGNPDDALPHEQKALTHLQRADAVFRDAQVAFGQGGGGGGGGGPRPQAEDLASLFELEMDKLRNQYETVEQQRRSSADNEVDELLQRLAELARRQEQENERTRRGVRQSGGGAGSSQNQLAAETEDVARRLERLARERSRPDLAAVSRRLRDAAQDMRSASNSSEGLESGLSAANALRGARRDLDEQRRARLGRDVQNALDETKRLRAAQDRIRDAVQDLGEERTREAIAQVSGQKQDLAERVQRLEQQLDEVSREWSRDEPEAAEAVGEAADGIRDRKLKEKIHYSRGVAAQRSGEYADQFEAMIANDLETLEQDLAEAREMVEGSDRAGQDDVLDRAASLVRGLEGLRNRLADQAERQESQPESQSGSQSESGSGSEAAQSGEGQGGGSAEGREARQLQRELDRRVQDAEALRRELTGIGASGDRGADRLGQVVDALRGLNPDRLTADPRGMEILEAEVLDTLRQLEFELRRALTGASGADVLTGSDDRAPAQYRDMVEEYFRALSRRPT